MIKPLTPKTMEIAKRSWPRETKTIRYRLKDSYTLDEFIDQFNTFVPPNHRKTATISHDDYDQWIEIAYCEQETDDEWEARITKLYREREKLAQENNKKQLEAERKTYERLKKKFEGK